MRVRCFAVAAPLGLLVGSVLAQTPDAVLFRNVNVLSMLTPEVSAAQALLVEDGRIAALGPDKDIVTPAGATVIDAAGGYLLPGLTEMHAHVPGVFERQYLEDVLFLYVANGVTTARGMLGQPAHLKLRDQLAAHEILGPRLVTSGPSLNGRSVASPEQAAEMVTDQAAAGYDFIKLHPGLTAAEFEAAMAAGVAAGIPLAGHVSTSVGLSRALAAGQATVDHLDGYMAYLIGDEQAADTPGFFGANWIQRVDPKHLPVAVELTRQAGTAVGTDPEPYRARHVAGTGSGRSKRDDLHAAANRRPVARGQRGPDERGRLFARQRRGLRAPAPLADQGAA